MSSVIARSQKESNITGIINRIHQLENKKDPKCYATANRLEDFMYGTPLNEEARNLKLEIQKALISYLKERGSQLANKRGETNITLSSLAPVIDEISTFAKDKNGDFLYRFGDDLIRIRKLDFDQYSSVSYAYRSLLSVEQELLLFSDPNLLPFDSETLEIVNDYVNLVTLVTLKLADGAARKNNHPSITKPLISKSWVALLSSTPKKDSGLVLKTPKKKDRDAPIKTDHTVIKQVIKQKLASYEAYNQVASSVFLRNVQVYLARQKWPTAAEASKDLKNYYLESLIRFSNELIYVSDKKARANKEVLIRVEHVQQALPLFLPEETNQFEDVTFFPKNKAEKMTVESYDLDAFRDSGIHWQILDYSIDDMQNEGLLSLDPNAAELVVEGIAQMGVLVLRYAGVFSHEKDKATLDIEDVNMAFAKIQKLIDGYHQLKSENDTAKISSSTSKEEAKGGFEEVGETLGIDFEHRSSDWLSRHIRSYTTSYSEKKIKLAIPPAFGGSGVACEDLNGDGFVDLLLLGGFGNKLYLNSKEGTFTDITEQAGINHWDDQRKSFGEVRQPIIVDFNNDGLQDIFISYVNDQHRLYKNLGDMKFQDVSDQANLGGENMVAGPATAFDHDNDGLLDIFIGYFGNYIDGTLPTIRRDNQNGMPNKLFKNKGNFVFEEVFFTDDEGSNTGWTQAVGHADIDQDGLQDIIVGNDFGVNKYYLNSKEGIFREVSKELGADKPSYTMNVGITDLNRDLFPDFYISNIVVMQKDEKYVNPNADTKMKFDPEKMATIRTVEANDLFLSKVDGKSLKGYSLSTDVGRGYSATGWSWDADFFDYDNDGDEDLYVLNGMNDFSVYSSENPFYFEREEQSRSISYAESNREKNVFFVNDGGQLINKASALGVDIHSNARSASYFDYDNDGDLDIVINNYHDRANLLENKSEAGNNWIKIKLIGDPEVRINKDAIGSSLVLQSKHHKNIWREIHSTTGYLSVHPKEQHFGLGKDTKANVEIRWSNGEVHKLKGLKANTAYIVEYPNFLIKK
ncbi:CRTAC1 family protein [Sungkyunkwania multivorans]|uniref:CRTAC1 family protein n=1 Tax=Sungkyunkwania multivorans TaxID=1173618 RepID=A0ABW3D3W9_9FLAO